MKVLVTGASGYLGQHVVRVLRERGISHSGLSRRSCDLTQLRSVERMFRGERPTKVIHCAAVVPKCSDDYWNVSAALLSVIMAANVALHARCPIVFVSSMTAADGQFVFLTDYARGKDQAEDLIRCRDNSDDRIVRLPGLFGPPREWGAIYDAEQDIARGDVPFVPVLDWPVATVGDAAEHLVAVALGEPHELRVTTGHAVISDLQRARTNG